MPARIFPYVDWFLLLITLFLLVFGLITLVGATSSGEGPQFWPINTYTRRQLIWSGLGIMLMIGMIFFDYRLLQRSIWLFYMVLIPLLAGLFLKDHAIKGARSWYDFGFMRFQPSEPAKLIIIVMTASWLAWRGNQFKGLRHIIIPSCLAAVPTLLILLQPDFGTAAVMIPILLVMFWVAGLRKRVFLFILLVGISLGATGFRHLKPYQQDRIISFLNPEADPLGKGYNVIQSQTALGSGQAFGKGWGEGTQTSFRFLPEYHTDFIFPTVGEQFGFAGCVVVLVTIMVFIWRLLWLARSCHDRFGVYIIAGITTLFATHMVFNIGMTIGLLPVTGLPLPFFSYGGSFMITCLLSIGLCVGIAARRQL
jgi:rod shape determining protein RodA